MKTLTVVDDCSKEAVQIAVDTSIPALYVTGVLDQVKAKRGLPRVIRTDNGPEFAGRTMQTWVAKNGVELRFIQPGKPVQNAYIESFNSRFRDECLSQHWFAGLSHMRSVIDNWRDDYSHHLVGDNDQVRSTRVPIVIERRLAQCPARRSRITKCKSTSNTG